ncbi:hypothetical protein LIER_38596 [Lithospermum erythrorhizon]|uniref:Uncharacterized protein n=1 Tax=Lithospermum erythrorhizon TaxID=34254 RepID=A0AAV3Q4R5_LITER
MQGGLNQLPLHRMILENQLLQLPLVVKIHVEEDDIGKPTLASRDEIHVEEDDIGKPIAPIVDLSEYSAAPSAADLMEESVNMSSADDTVTKAGKQPSVKNLDEVVDPSIKNTVDKLKEKASIWGDEDRPTVVDTGNDTENVTPSVGDT